MAGYEQRDEYIAGEKAWRNYLGPDLYRQSVASRALTIIGGLVTFGGVVSLLAIFGSLADNTNYGQQSVGNFRTNYDTYIYGFSAMTGVGGAMLITGLVLALPLPPRYRPMVLPRLQVVEPLRF